MNDRILSWTIWGFGFIDVNIVGGDSGMVEFASAKLR